VAVPSVLLDVYDVVAIYCIRRVLEMAVPARPALHHS
jgi:hypothetical protein